MQWSSELGVNRLINTDHVQQLVESFRSRGILRTAPEHHVRAICRAQDWMAIRDHHQPYWTDQLLQLDEFTGPFVLPRIPDTSRKGPSDSAVAESYSAPIRVIGRATPT
jgi:hypothetical protein